VYSYKNVLDYGLTGVMSRSVGIKRDLRLSKLETYSNYYYLNFRSFIGNHGDSYDRFLIRMNEMSESLSICNQIIIKIKDKSSYLNEDTDFNFNKHQLSEYINYDEKNSSYNNMEELIHHFKG